MTGRRTPWAVGAGTALVLALAAGTLPGALRDPPATARPGAPPGAVSDGAGRAAADAPAGTRGAATGDGSPADDAPPAAGSRPSAAAARDAGRTSAVVPPPQAAPPAAPVSTARASTGEPVPAPPEAAAGVRVVRPFAAVAVPGTAGGITVDAGGRVHTATDAPGDAPGPSQLLTYDSAGSLQRTTAVPGQSISRTRGVTALATARDGTLLAADAASGRVLRHDPVRRRWIVRSSVRDLAPCLLPDDFGCQPGVLDTAPLLTGIAVAPDGTAYVADAGQGTVFVLPRGEPARPWWSADDVLGADGLAGLDVDADGHVLVAVGRLADPLGRELGGAVLRIRREDDGTAGPRSTVAGFPAGQRPADVAAAPARSTYVAVRGQPALVLLDRSGDEVRRITDDALGDPTGLHLLPGRALVSVGGPRKAVVEVDLAER